MRAYLGIRPDENFTVSGKMYEFPTTETLTRYEQFTDGRIANKKRCVAAFEYDCGKTAWYDFDSEQYRSPIRKNTVKVQGIRGEMIDDRIYYLDKNNKGQADQIITGFHITRTDNPNPNLSEIYEVEKISCAGKVLYEPQWGLRGLSEDETAVATLMIKTALYNRDEAPAPYSVEDAIADAYAAILLKEAVKTGKCIRSDMKRIKE